jgi:hypothetical protein
VETALEGAIEQSGEFNLLDEFARRVFDKLSSSKAVKSAFLLDKFARARQLNSLLDSVTLLAF